MLQMYNKKTSKFYFFSLSAQQSEIIEKVDIFSINRI